MNFNPYELQNILNSSTNPFYTPMNPVSLKWGLEVTKNVFILESDAGTCVVSAPFTIINLSKNKELFNAILGLQEELNVGQFSFKSSKNSIEVIYEAKFSKDLIEDLDNFQNFLDDIYDDIGFMKDFSQSVEEKFLALSKLKGQSQDDFTEDLEEDEKEIDLNYLKDTLQTILDSENNKEEENEENDES